MTKRKQRIPCDIENYKISYPIRISSKFTEWMSRIYFHPTTKFDLTLRRLIKFNGWSKTNSKINNQKFFWEEKQVKPNLTWQRIKVEKGYWQQIVSNKEGKKERKKERKKLTN